jgi:hypothetical protein
MSYLNRSHFGGSPAALLLCAGVFFTCFSLSPCLVCRGQESPRIAVETNNSASAAEASPAKVRAGRMGSGTIMLAGLIVLGCGGVVASSLMLVRRRGRKASNRRSYPARPVAAEVSAPSSGTGVIGSTRENIGSSQVTASDQPAVVPKANGRHRRGARRRKSVDYTRFFMDLRSTVSDHSTYIEPELPSGFSLQPESPMLPEAPPPQVSAPRVSVPVSASASANSEMIANQKHLIEEQQRLIHEQTKLIEEKTRLLAEKSALLARQSELIDERLLPS